MIDPIIKRLRETKEPHHGIFWFVKTDEEEDYHIIYLDIPQSQEILGNSKNGLTYTHERTWKDLVINQDREIQNKDWNYFPRGRVDIRNNRATIYLNPNINEEPYQNMIIYAFKLRSIPYRFVSDGSDHYQCYLDRR